MSAQTQPVALPPKLHQLLSSMPDVDKVKLMQIAHHYKMDLDDPGFLPLLLTQQGITALENARAEMVLDVDKSLERMAGKIVDASAGESERLKDYSTQLAGFLKQQAAEAEASMKQALATWAHDALIEAIANAICEQAAKTTAAAEARANAASVAFAGCCEQSALIVKMAGVDAAAAAKKAHEAVVQLGTAWLLAALLGGMVAGAMMLELIKRLTTQ